MRTMLTVGYIMITRRILLSRVHDKQKQIICGIKVVTDTTR